MVIYDVRAFESWEAEHIEGSKSLPWGKLEDDVKKLPRDKPLVLYCA
jgi:hydroxyacylglutathione hydrolase